MLLMYYIKMEVYIKFKVVLHALSIVHILPSILKYII